MCVHAHHVIVIMYHVMRVSITCVSIPILCDSITLTAHCDSARRSHEISIHYVDRTWYRYIAPLTLTNERTMLRYAMRAVVIG